MRFWTSWISSSKQTHVCVTYTKFGFDQTNKVEDINFKFLQFFLIGFALCVQIFIKNGWVVVGVKKYYFKHLDLIGTPSTGFSNILMTSSFDHDMSSMSIRVTILYLKFNLLWLWQTDCGFMTQRAVGIVPTMCVERQLWTIPFIYAFNPSFCHVVTKWLVYIKFVFLVAVLHSILCICAIF